MGKTGQQFTERVVARITPEQLSMLETQAKTEGRSASNMMRALIERGHEASKPQRDRRRKNLESFFGPVFEEENHEQTTDGDV